MPSIDALAAAIRVALDRIRGATASIAASRTAAEEVRDWFARLGADAKTSQASMIVDALEEQQAAAQAAADRAEAVLARAERARGAGGGGGGAPPGPPPRPTAGGEPFRPMRTDRAKAEEIRPYVGEPIAYARQYGPDGRPLGPVHVASDDGPAAAAADVREPWSSSARLRRHVEAHAAARMRQDGMQESALYINLPPCRYPDGCARNVADLLPVGRVLWVHQVKANGGVRVHRFSGTGRGLSNAGD